MTEPPPPPGPPGGPGYGALGFGQVYSVGDGFMWALNKLSKNAVALIVPSLVYAVIPAVIGGIFYGGAVALAPAPESSYTSSDNGFAFSFSSGFGVASVLVMIIGWIVLLVVGGVVHAAFLSGVLDIANGRQVTIGDFFKPRNVGNVIVATLIVGVLTGIASIFCVFPALIVGFFLLYTIIALLDLNLSPVDAIRASFETTTKNIGAAALAWLVTVAIVLVGLIAFGVGLIVAAPVEMLFLVYTFRRLNGAEVAPLTP
jgi:uncharacterized membrane protein